MRFNILSIYIISLLTVSCVEKENTDKKIEIYLTNKRIESYEGIKPENLKDTTKFKDLLERFNKIAIKLDTINNDIIFAGAFNANDEDLDVKPLINSNEILMFDFTSSKIIMKESVVKKIKDLDWKMGDDFGRQFVLCINKKPVLNGYFYHPASSYLSNTYQIFIDDYIKNGSEVSYKIYFGKDLNTPNLKENKEFSKIW